MFCGSQVMPVKLAVVLGIFSAAMHVVSLGPLAIRNANKDVARFFSRCPENDRNLVYHCFKINLLFYFLLLLEMMRWMVFGLIYVIFFD
jgi:hypothetical protein